MAMQPAVEEAERAILELYKKNGKRPDHYITHVALMSSLTDGVQRFTADDFNTAIKSMHEKGWIDATKKQGFYFLLDLGFAQI
jgi:hypothetical protein